MNNDTDWVADVKRWVLTGATPDEAGSTGSDDGGDVGYEAAHPALEARHWLDATSTATALTTGR